ncbi:hypothetical protein E3N88_01049 [Mikania micrantha]|uniref:Uncharacterized protein n=1 Tax=Mikania micrantha TaxID=192012 RepID=A0A5N6Q0L1_9ASTR|nr:hypothetical protein E3N88_01049 [Mikania micrantha]
MKVKVALSEKDEAIKVLLVKKMNMALGWVNPTVQTNAFAFAKPWQRQGTSRQEKMRKLSKHICSKGKYEHQVQRATVVKLLYANSNIESYQEKEQGRPGGQNLNKGPAWSINQAGWEAGSPSEGQGRRTL